MYKQVKKIENNPIDTIIFLYDNTFIPFDYANKDYQIYLKWVSEGGVPLPADE